MFEIYHNKIIKGCIKPICILKYLGISQASPKECHSSVSLLVTQFIRRLIASLVSNGDTTLDGMFGLY